MAEQCNVKSQWWSALDHRNIDWRYHFSMQLTDCKAHYVHDYTPNRFSMMELVSCWCRCFDRRGHFWRNSGIAVICPVIIGFPWAPSVFFCHVYWSTKTRVSCLTKNSNEWTASFYSTTTHVTRSTRASFPRFSLFLLTTTVEKERIFTKEKKFLSQTKPSLQRQRLPERYGSLRVRVAELKDFFFCVETMPLLTMERLKHLPEKVCSWNSSDCAILMEKNDEIMRHRHSTAKHNVVRQIRNCLRFTHMRSHFTHCKERVCRWIYLAFHWRNRFSVINSYCLFPNSFELFAQATVSFSARKKKNHLMPFDRTKLLFLFLFCIVYQHRSATP